MKIGVLAVQGAFIEHVQILKRLGVDAVEVRLPEELNDIDRLIIPGGESMTITNLMSHALVIANGCTSQEIIARFSRAVYPLATKDY